ncbi:hypothetical protein SLEP1_g12504 [Rubroshorea leprosula]|uniref:Root UVB sensitive protein C-terminal domain-containing protein n=1 Tax=Rubroshorea leprosula TaxID=152421 RepID=A0AAV5IM60_9ROSI|nr:hypothetical protein SLEP1_g12504 [Rubroshorea leprosula]
MYLLVERRGMINVVLHKDSIPTDVLQSYIHSLVLAKNTDEKRSLHSESQSWMDKQYEIFLQKLKASGWKIERLLCPSIIWKAHWMQGQFNEKID